jgi:hypothetical protein
MRGPVTLVAAALGAGLADAGGVRFPRGAAVVEEQRR